MLPVLPMGDPVHDGADDAVTTEFTHREQGGDSCHYDTWPPIEQDAAALQLSGSDPR